jgi:hypothetical protein
MSDETQDQPQTVDGPQEGQEAPQGQPQADWENRVRELEAKLEQADEEKRQAVQDAISQQRGDRPQRGGVTVDLSDMDQGERAKRYEDWPQEGGGDLPQPWDHRALGLHNAVRDHEENERPGAPNTVSPIVIGHGRPILSSGSADPSVHELGRILGDLGFSNSVSDGQNPYGSVDNSVMAAVMQFRDAYGVEEDPTGWGGNTPDGRARAAAHIGPWTWEAVLRAGRRADEDRAA